MFAQKKFCFTFILLHIHWGVATPHQPLQMEPHANSRSFALLEQQQQQHLFDATHNYYVPNTHNSQQYSNYADSSATQFYGYDANGTPNHQVVYQYPTPSIRPQLWSSAPIVVADDADNVLTHNDQTPNDYQRDLETRPRSSKALQLTYNINVPGQQQQHIPSNYNYPNPAVYHSSDVWRQQQQHQQQQQQLNHQQPQQHPINSPPQSKELNSLSYNRQQSQYQDVAQPLPSPPPPYPQQHHQQQHPQQHQQHQLYATNTDLNYLQATPINNRPHSSAREVGTKDTTADYSEHFKEYLRKHPRRINPVY